MKLRPFKLAFLVFISIIAFNCKSSTEPEDKKAVPDSTSQNFTFEVKRFGGTSISSCIFYDVWIFNENDIWTCGDVPTGDSLDGNLMHWNGRYWKGIRNSYAEVYSIWHDGTRFYLANGGVAKVENEKYELVTSYKGGTFTQGQRVTQLWIGSPENIWGIGPWGTIVHFNGKEWEKLDFDTQWHFYSITGSKITGVSYALALNSQYQTSIVKLQNSAAEVIYTSQSQNTEFNGWTLTLANEKELFIGNGPIWKFNIETKAKQVIFTPTSGTSIGASFAVSPIDIYFYGINWTTDVMIHYNGKRFKEFALPSHSDITGGIKATSNIAAAVSFAGNQAQIITIKRR
ncbi:MAG: hypothetical protein ACM3S2_19955 [Ignavibacteriales bacterium]